MKLKLAENSLFAILLRSPWWASVLAALAVFGVVRLFLHEGYALFAASPFIVIAALAGWKRLRTPGGARLEAALAKLRGMPWEEFAVALEAGFRREGYAVKRLDSSSTDFELVKDGRVSLVAAKRWKATQTGVEPLRDLHAAGSERDCVYVLVGEMTQNAKAFAREKKIRLVEAVEIVRLAS
jgi:restriction system protein